MRRASPRKQPPKPVRRKSAKSVWVRTFEAEDAIYIVIRAKRERIPEVNVLGPPVKIDLAEEAEVRRAKVKKEKA